MFHASCSRITMAEPKEEFKEREWKCAECDYVYIGEEPPAQCPKCDAPKEAFVPAEDIDFGMESGN